MNYRFTKNDGTVITETNPNWVKMNPRYPSFICCGESDAECVILSEGDEQIQYNLNTDRYYEFKTVKCDRI